MKKLYFFAIAALGVSMALASCSSDKEEQNTEQANDKNEQSEDIKAVKDDNPQQKRREAFAKAMEAKEAKLFDGDELQLPDASSRARKKNSEKPTDSWMPSNATVTKSGLGIVIEKPGEERHAAYNTPVLVHYRGRLTNGRVFDSSYDRGAPTTFSASQVVPGFGEGIMMIGKGGKATLYIPSNLAYGENGVPEAGIGPNENLIFDIEIIDIAQ